jgi:hypothetical protein
MAQYGPPRMSAFATLLNEDGTLNRKRPAKLARSYGTRWIPPVPHGTRYSSRRHRWDPRETHALLWDPFLPAWVPDKTRSTSVLGGGNCL